MATEVFSINDVFAIRSEEKFWVQSEQPTSGRWLAIMKRSVTMPDGPKQKARPTDGKPVEAAAIVAAQLQDGEWQWVQLSPVSKEIIGDMIFDDPQWLMDRWYYLVIEQQQ